MRALEQLKISARKKVYGRILVDEDGIRLNFFC